MANNNRFSNSKVRITQVEGSEDLFIAHKVPVRWAVVHTPKASVGSDDKVYSVEILVDKKTASDFIDQKIKSSLRPAKDTEGLYQISLSRSSVYKKSGDDRKPPSVLDSACNEFTQEIGNGSICNVQFKIRDWEFKGKTGLTADLVAIQVIELVSYVSKADKIAFKAEDGFVAGTVKAKVNDDSDFSTEDDGNDVDGSEEGASDWD